MGHRGPRGSGPEVQVGDASRRTHVDPLLRVLAGRHEGRLHGAEGLGSQQPAAELRRGRRRPAGGQAVATLATNARLGYGFEFIWTPDSKTVAYIASGTGDEGPDHRVAGRRPARAHAQGAKACPASTRARASTRPMSDAKGELLRHRRRRALARRRRERSGKGRREDPGLEHPRYRPAVRPRHAAARPTARTVWVARAARRPPRPGPGGRRPTGTTADKAGFFASTSPPARRARLLEEDKSVAHDLQSRRRARRPARSSSRRPTSSTCTTCGSSTRRPARRARSPT